MTKITIRVMFLLEGIEISFSIFGNNLANGYTIELYTQQGMTRTFGVTLSRDF